MNTFPTMSACNTASLKEAYNIIRAVPVMDRAWGYSQLTHPGIVRKNFEKMMKQHRRLARKFPETFTSERKLKIARQYLQTFVKSLAWMPGCSTMF